MNGTLRKWLISNEYLEEVCKLDQISENSDEIDLLLSNLFGVEYIPYKPENNIEDEKNNDLDICAT